jgi:sugar lactone lactonase YvrE
VEILTVKRTSLLSLATALGLLTGTTAAQDSAKTKWISATAYAVPMETAPEGEGYFSIIEGHNGRLYIGTHANALNSWLVEFDPKAKKMNTVVDVHKAIGIDLRGFGAQAKIHTRNNVGKVTGKIYFGTKQGYPDEKKEKREDYPGGYPMTYDPKTGKTQVFPIPVKHHGINSIMPDESRDIAYISTCSDHRPGPGENAIFLVLDLKTGKYREIMDTQHIYGFICLDHKGRAYHPVKGGSIARYDPDKNKLDIVKQTIDGQPPTKDSHLADDATHPLNWDASPDGKTLYCVPMSTNQLYAYDLTAEGDTIPGRTVGTLIPGAKQTDCRAMCTGPKGQVCVAVTGQDAKSGAYLLHMVTYKPGEKAPRDHGIVEVTNPDYTPFNDKDGKPLPSHHGFFKLDGHTTSKYVILGVCEAKDGAVYILALSPYTVLQVQPEQIK